MFFLSSYDHFQRKLIIIAKSQGFFPWLFSLSWEQRKLGEVVKEVTRNDPTSDAPIMMITANNGFIEQSERYAFNNAGESLKKYILLEKGELAYNHGASKLRPYGSCFALTTVENARIPFVYHCFSVEDHDPEFMSIELNGADVENQLRRIVSSGARMDGLLNISFEEYTSVEVLLPERAEQERISSFFRSLDDLITLHQHEPWFLVMLFSGGSCVFKSAWEQRKLGDCFSERVESMPDGELISVTINDGIKKFSELGRHDNSNEDKSKYKKVCVGDIAYNSMRMWQGASGYSPYEGIVSPAYTVLTPNTGIISKCLAYQFKLPEMTHTFQIHSQGITSDNWNLKYPTLSEIKIFVSPDEKEQEQIARFFTNLDNLITLHQREGNLREKKSLNFAWEQRKLGELVDRVVRKNTNNESTLPLTISAQYGLVDQITYFNNRVASRDVSNYYLVLNGEFAYNKSTSDGYPFGAVKRLDLYEKGVLSTLYIVFAPKKEQQIDSDYLTVFFDTDRWHKGVAERAAEGARNHGLLNISAEDFFDIDLSVPKDIVEQKQIGAFIRQLDNLITLHQREHKSNFRRKTNVKQSTRDRPFLLLLCSVDKGLQRGSGP